MFSVTKIFSFSPFIRREATIRSLITSHDSYDELIGKLQRGRDYFYHLDEAVVKTLRGCRSEYSVLDDEWSKIMMSPGSVGGDLFESPDKEWRCLC